MSSNPTCTLLIGALALAACTPEEAEVTGPGTPTSGTSTSQPTSQPTDASTAAVFEPSTFAEFVRTEDDSGRFDVKIVTYEKDDTKVSLIASVHIADARHYQELNEEFENYDALLYELVANPDKRPKPGEPKKKGGFNPISLLQQAMTKGLELSFQLDNIDYTKDNFVHADLTPKGMARAMEANNESILTIAINMIQRQSKMQAEQREREVDGEAPREFDIVKAMRSGYGRHTLRMMVAEQLTAIEALALGGGEEEGDDMVLLEGRNDRALEVLREQMAEGKKNLGIYYGAAHMPDMERKLIRDFGFRKSGERTLMAWDITKRPDESK